MKEPILIRGARQLVTLCGLAGPRRGAALNDLAIIPDGAILIRDGCIDQAGPTRRVENLRAARNAREINAAGRVVMPGFVDARAQLWPMKARQGSGRGPAELSALPGRLLAARARNVLAGMARHGTTTVCAVTSAASDHAAELKMLRVLARLDGRPLGVSGAYVGSSSVQSEPRSDRAAQIESLCTEVMPVIARRKLARFAVADCGAFEPPDIRRFLACARHLGFRLRVWARAGLSCVSLALEMEAASVALDGIEEEISGLAKSRTIALLQPASGGPPGLDRRSAARTLIESGAAIALASGFGFEDGPTYNMQMVISLACSEMGLSPAEAVSAATINAAHALAYGEELGSLEPGKRADVIMLNVEDYRDLSHLFGINHVHMVLKNGEVIYQEGEVTHWDGK
ncbi:MAG: amidohydrolase family protein [Acidobacteriia bacterium]|nr:amidohydrolase family protein [Terriglobia bacterium]